MDVIVTKYCRFSAGGAFDLASLGYHHEYRDGDFFDGVSFAAVHHAEVIAHKVGEPFGTLVLALAVTVIEVALILALMSSSTPTDAAVLARDTVFAAVMLICNGIIGICLLIGGIKNYVQRYSLHGSKAAISVLLAIALIVFILPNFTTSAAGGFMIGAQLLFVAICCLILYAAFIFTQTIRHRDYFILCCRKTTDFRRWI